MKLALDATCRGEPDDRAIARIVGLYRRGFVQLSNLWYLQAGYWARGLSAAGLREILILMRESADELGTRIALVCTADWMRDATHDLQPPLDELAWHFLESKAGWTSDHDTSHAWRTIANHLVVQDPDRVAKAVVQCFLDGRVGYRDQRLESLRLALEASPPDVVATIGEALLGDGPRWHLKWDLSDLSLLDRAPTEVVMKWVRANAPTGAAAIAGTLRPGGANRIVIRQEDDDTDGRPLSETIRALLREYPEESAGLLTSNFYRGGWAGSEVSYFDRRIAMARLWTKDDDAAVRQWANTLLGDLQRSRAQAVIRDQERGLD